MSKHTHVLPVLKCFHHLMDDDDDDDHDDDHHDDDGFHCKIVGLRCPWNLRLRSIVFLCKIDQLRCPSNLTLRWLLSTLHPSIPGRPGASVRIVFRPVWKIIVFFNRVRFFFFLTAVSPIDTPDTSDTPETRDTPDAQDPGRSGRPGHHRDHGHRRKCTTTIVINTFQSLVWPTRHLWRSQ